MIKEQQGRPAGSSTHSNKKPRKRSHGAMIKSRTSKRLNQPMWFVVDGRRVRRRLCTMVDEVFLSLKPGVKFAPLPAEQPVDSGTQEEGTGVNAV